MTQALWKADFNKMEAEMKAEEEMMEAEMMEMEEDMMKMEEPDMPKASEELKKMPDGKKVEKVFNTVAGWVKKVEAIDAKAKPAAMRRERALEDASKDRFEEVVDILEDADKDYKKNDE